jgi:hypothetical protein
VASYNFAQIPVVRDRYPLWTDDGDVVDVPVGIEPQPGGVVLAPREHHHETLETVGLDARYGGVLEMVGPSYWPLGVAVSTFLAFFGFLIHNAVTLSAGLVAVAGSMVGWHFDEIRREDG